MEREAMEEACFCGRAGDIADRKPLMHNGERVLECRCCGHHELIRWWPNIPGERLWDQALLRDGLRTNGSVAGPVRATRAEGG